MARLDESEKLKYQLDQKTKEAEDWKGQVNALTLKDEASSYAREKGLPFEYIEDIDYAKENAESIKKRIDKLSDLRGKDLSNYLNEKLKQSPPKAVDNDKSKEDPYIQGFKNYNKNNKK